MNEQKPMSYEEGAIEFLSSPQNLRLALEIFRVIPGLKESLTLKFWKKLEKKMETNLLTAKAELLEWKLVKSDETCLKSLTSNSGIMICPKSTLKVNELHFAFKVENKKAFFGIEWKKEAKIKVSDFPDSLKKMLDELTGTEWIKRNYIHWPVWKWTDYQLDSDDTLLKFAEGDEVEEDLAQQLLTFFEKYRNKVEQANIELQGCNIKN